jgi:hypothetical protein
MFVVVFVSVHLVSFKAATTAFIARAEYRHYPAA